MGAYNWIEIQGFCPKCEILATIKCQTHFCSTYDGDTTGRFFDRSYKIGDTMAWWPKMDSRYGAWRDSNYKGTDERKQNSECCYGECQNCLVELFCVIFFKDRVPIEFSKIGLEDDWPKDFFK